MDQVRPKYGSGAPKIWIRCAQNSLKKLEGAEVSMQLIRGCRGVYAIERPDGHFGTEDWCPFWRGYWQQRCTCTWQYVHDKIQECRVRECELKVKYMSHFRTKSAGDLRRHMEVHNEKKMFNCEFPGCDYSHKTFNGVSYHYRLLHQVYS
jgi:hypothetical protein